MKLRTQILASNGIIILLMVASGWLVYHRVTWMRESSEIVREDYQAINAGNRLFTEMINMETGSRGYLVTGKEAYLEPFHMGLEAFDTTLEEARNFVEGHSNQYSLLEQIDVLHDEWLNTVGYPQNAIRRQINQGEATVEAFETIRTSSEDRDIFAHIRVAISKLDSLFDGEENQEIAGIVDLLMVNLLNQQTGLRGFLLTGEEASLDPYQKDILSFDRDLEILRNIITERPDSALLMAELTQLEALVNKWHENVVSPNIEARLAVNAVEVTQKDLTEFLDRGDGKRLMGQLREKIGDFIGSEEAMLAIEKAASLRQSKEALLFIVLSSLCAVIVAIVATAMLTRRVLKQVGGEPLEIAALGQRIALGDFDLKLTKKEGDEDSMYESLRLIANSFSQVVEQAKQVADGNFSTPIELRSDNDQLGLTLQRMASNLAETTRKNERESWLRTGQSGLDEQIRGDLDRNEMTRKVLSFIADYLDAQVAVFYIAEDSGFKLVNSYAYKERKSNDTLFKLGEGLIGQAALERKVIHFREVPEEHVSTRITSGTGNSAPKSILVVPFVHNDDVLGVLELGSAAGFDERALDLIERARNAIAISLFTVFSRERAKLLVEELENQAVELETQREDLQKTNASLEEQSQALKESQAELESQREELMVNNEQLDKRGQALDRNNAELEKAKKAIEEKAEALALSGKYKSQFLSNMSHELRTPLNSLLLLSESLMKNKTGNLNEKQVEFAETIHSSGEELLNLINDVLDLAKIESGTVELYIEPLSLSELKDYVKSRFKHVAEAKGVELPIHYGEGLPDEIKTDKEKLQQVIKNLLSNALKFTEKGSVTLEVYRPEPNDFLESEGLKSDECIALSVKDTGIGISKESASGIFEAFQQADGRTNRKYGGTGLGLTISQELIHYMGGRIELQSEFGKGSTFIVYLPVDSTSAQTKMNTSAPSTAVSVKSSEPTATAQSMDAQAGGAVADAVPEVEDDRNQITENDRVLLVVEDDIDFAEVVADLARERGFKVIIAVDGLDGLELANKYAPSAIILDVGLPRIDGWKVMEELKRSPKTRHIPVNFVSARDKDPKAMHMGALDFLTKPVSRQDLISALTKTEHFIDKSIKNLLLVEDDVGTGKAMVETIGDGDVVITVATSGKEALEKLADGDFDCIVLDLGLGDMSGFDLLKQVHEDAKNADIPVIIYTGRDLTIEEERRLKKMSDSIIIKGVNSMERLLGEITLFLHRVEERMPKEKQRMLRMAFEDVLNGKVALVVDDDAKNTYAITNLLEEVGVTCVQAFDGKEALKCLDEFKGKVNIVLTDIMMPEMDGYELMRQIRKLEAFKRIPIIALTAKAMQEDREQCIDAGASDYLTKPIDSSKLLSLMRVWMS